jgi:hypothetical protein
MSAMYSSARLVGGAQEGKAATDEILYGRTQKVKEPKN